MEMVLEGESQKKHTRSRSLSLPDKKRGRGRPPTIGEYVGLTEAKNALNEQKKEEERLGWEKKVRTMSEGYLLSNMGIDLDEAADDMKQDPTADVASRAHEKMLEVLRVARKSKNLHGYAAKS